MAIIQSEKMNSEQFTIKTVHPDEWKTLLDISRQTFIEAYGKDTNAADLQLYVSQNITASILKQQLNNPKIRFFFLKNESDVIAYAKLRWDRPHEHFQETSAIELEHLYTKKVYWGKGYGSQLLDHCVEFAKAQGFAWLWLLVWHENAAAIRFYQRHGFKQFGFQHFTFGTEITNDWIMKKELR